MGNITAIHNPTIGMYAKGNFAGEKVTNCVNASWPARREDSKQYQFRYMPTPTPHFQGREHIIKGIRDHFANLPPKANDCWKRIAVITGPAGMGKTELAYKFANTYKETYPNVARISAETEESIRGSFLKLAKGLDIVPRYHKTADVQLVKSIYRYIDREFSGKVLLIFDNAIRLDSVGAEFGIKEYLPTEDLLNGRFPHIIVTTQTREWGKQIETVQVDALREEESLKFFSDCWKIKSGAGHGTEIDALCKKLHQLLQGYPLAMNLAASVIDYNRTDPSSPDQLRQQINLYIQKLEEEDGRILTEEIKEWRTDYKKTLAGAWESTFKRLKKEENGTEALELLQILSLLKLPGTNYVNSVLVLCTQYSCNANRELKFGLKRLVYLLQKCNAAIVLKSSEDSTLGEIFELAVNRLFQLVLRQETDCRQAITRFMCYFARERSMYRSVYSFRYMLNKSVFDAVLQRTQLSLWRWPYAGIVSLNTDPAYRKIVESREPVEKTAVVIRLLGIGTIGLEG